MLLELLQNQAAGQARYPREHKAGVQECFCWRMKRFIFKARFPFSRGFFHGSHIQAVQPSFSRLHGHHTRQKEEGASSIVKGKGPGRFIKQALGPWKECGLHLIPLESRRGNVRINQRTCTLYSEGCKLNMPGFPHLSDS